MRETAENTGLLFSPYIIVFDGVRPTQSGGDRVIVLRVRYYHERLDQKKTFGKAYKLWMGPAGDRATTVPLVQQIARDDQAFSSWVQRTLVGSCK